MFDFTNRASHQPIHGKTDLKSTASLSENSDACPAATLEDEAFTTFARRCNGIVGQNLDEPETLEAIRELTEAFVSGWRIRDPRYLVCVPDSPYASYLLYVNEQATLSIVLDVFMPGQAAVIHNHRCWCAFVCLAGKERERLYEVAPGLAAAPEQIEERICPAGNVRLLVSERHLFHQVECASAKPAVSLHLYGADIGRLDRDLWDAEAGPRGEFVTFRSDYSNEVMGLPAYFTPAS